MKNLSVQSAKELKAMISLFNKEIDLAKKDLISKEIIAKFGIDSFADASKEIKKDAPKSASNQSKKSIDKDAPINKKMLDALNAIGITDKLKSLGGKSIFKKEFNNKTDRTKCRNQFQNSISIYLLHVAHNKADLAKVEHAKIVAIADKYYIAESAFKNKSDYCTDNMDENKKELINMFIALQADAPVQEKKKRITNKKVDAPKKEIELV